MTGRTHGLLSSSLYAPTPRFTFCGKASSLYAAVSLKILYDAHQHPHNKEWAETGETTHASGGASGTSCQFSADTVSDIVLATFSFGADEEAFAFALALGEEDVEGEDAERWFASCLILSAIMQRS